MKILEFGNKAIMMMVTTAAILKSPTALGTNLTLTVDDNNDFLINNFVLFGELGKAQSEIASVASSPARGTSLPITALKFPHNIGCPIYKIPYNQVKFFHSDTLTGDKTQIGSTQDIDADNEFTTIVDNDNDSGYLFFALYNSYTEEQSGYSAGFSYDNAPYGSRIKIREFVTSPNNWNKALDETTFNTLCDFAESELFALKRWTFREKIATFNTVAGQQSYTLAEAGVTDLGQLVYATYDGNPVWPVDLRVHKRLNWHNIQQGISRHVCFFEKKLLFTPIPGEAKEVELYYYRNSAGFADDTVETEIKLPQAIGFRVLQDLWAIPDPKKAKYFEMRYLQAVAAMKLDDIKQVTKFPVLSDGNMDNSDRVFDQVMNPNRIS